MSTNFLKITQIEDEVEFTTIINLDLWDISIISGIDNGSYISFISKTTFNTGYPELLKMKCKEAPQQIKDSLNENLKKK
jgi:hypothetical protein